MAERSKDTNKRAKRPRGSSPGGRANTPSTPRGSVGPQGVPPFSREVKARKDALPAQLPLQAGRMVAFHQPSAQGKLNGAEKVDGENTPWILAKVVRCIGQDKKRCVISSARCVKASKQTTRQIRGSRHRAFRGWKPWSVSRVLTFRTPRIDGARSDATKQH
jgi:hypothetical protein